MTSPAIEIDGLTRSFGRKQALDSVSIKVPAGCVFGLVGENGAGKTTLLKHIMGLYRPQHGSVRVLGLEPTEHPVRVLSQVGYLSEDRTQPEWMTVAQIIAYTSAFYENWDHQFADELCDRFELVSNQKIQNLSRGQRARVGLLLALAYRPSLLVLDEPSSGLDAIVRKDILAAIIRTVADEGRTVLFSSHLLGEVQRVSDRFAMIHQGRVILSGDLEEVMDAHEKLTVRFSTPQHEPPKVDAAVVSGDGQEWALLCNGNREIVAKQLLNAGGEVVERARPTLEELFMTKAKRTENLP